MRFRKKLSANNKKHTEMWDLLRNLFKFLIGFFFLGTNIR